MTGDSLRLELTNLSELGSLRQALTEFGRAHNLAADAVNGVAVAVDEIVTNIVSHGFSGQGAHRITLSMILDEENLCIEVHDHGPPFNPLDAPAPDIECALEERPVGGLGIHLVRSLMDNVAYRRHDGRNILAMRKNAAR